LKNPKKKNNEHYVYFRGARLNKSQANNVGVGIIFGVIGAFFSLLLPFEDQNIASYLTILVFAFLGYFFIGPKIFNRRSSENNQKKP
jgi:hypothetical protein